MTAATKTFSPRPRDIERRWYVVDADGAVLGRLASEVAKILRGKHKPIFAPHADTGDHVIVVNARKAVLTGGKEQKKVYYRHSQYPGGLREIGYARLMSERPAVAVEKAIKGMLPKNSLGRQILRKLSVYEGADHPHAAQKPVPLALGDIPPWTGLPAPKPSAPKPGHSSRGGPDGAGQRKSMGGEAGRSAVASPAKSSAKGSPEAAPARASRAKRATAKEGTAPAGGRATRARGPRGGSSPTSGRKASKQEKES